MFLASSRGEEVLCVRESEELACEAWEVLSEPLLFRGLSGCSDIGSSPSSIVTASARDRLRTATALS